MTKNRASNVSQKAKLAEATKLKTTAKNTMLNPEKNLPEHTFFAFSLSLEKK
jgi:hypothetical protein